GAGRGHVLDDDHALAIARRVTDEASTLAVVLGLLAVEAVGDVAAVLGGEGDRGGDDQRDALVGRTEEDVEAVAETRADGGGVEAAEALHLAAAAEAREVEEVGRAPAALRLEVAEGEHAGREQELDELARLRLRGVAHDAACGGAARVRALVGATGFEP